MDKEPTEFILIPTDDKLLQLSILFGEFYESRPIEVYPYVHGPTPEEVRLMIEAFHHAGYAIIQHEGLAALINQRA